MRWNIKPEPEKQDIKEAHLWATFFPVKTVDTKEWVMNETVWRRWEMVANHGMGDHYSAYRYYSEEPEYKEWGTPTP